MKYETRENWYRFWCVMFFLVFAVAVISVFVIDCNRVNNVTGDSRSENVIVDTTPEEPDPLTVEDAAAIAIRHHYIYH